MFHLSKQIGRGVPFLSGKTLFCVVTNQAVLRNSIQESLPINKVKQINQMCASPFLGIR